jgi:hypothetical protein
MPIWGENGERIVYQAISGNWMIKGAVEFI